MENNPILLKFRGSNKGLENDDLHVTPEKILSEEGFVSNIDPQGKGSVLCLLKKSSGLASFQHESGRASISLTGNVLQQQVRR
jgi:hypothetical protein